MTHGKMYNDDGYLNLAYAIRPTTWAYCWRCGEKISLAHTQDVQDGVHKACRTENMIAAVDRDNRLLNDIGILQLQIG